MNALSDRRVSDYLRDNYVSTYLKVGTFQIINGQKVGGNVASYFCLPDGSVVHAVPGKVGGQKLLEEARWAYEIRKSALTRSTDLVAGAVDAEKFRALIQDAHVERFLAEANLGRRPDPRGQMLLRLPEVPPGIPQQAQAHWLLAKAPLERLESLYPVVWQQVLNEPLSGLPVARR